MEKRTQTGLVMGHAYGVTAVKKVHVNFATIIHHRTPDHEVHVHTSILIFNCHVIACN